MMKSYGHVLFVPARLAQSLTYEKIRILRAIATTMLTVAQDVDDGPQQEKLTIHKVENMRIAQSRSVMPLGRSGASSRSLLSLHIKAMLLALRVLRNIKQVLDKFTKSLGDNSLNICKPLSR